MSAGPAVKVQETRGAGAGSRAAPELRAGQGRPRAPPAAPTAPPALPAANTNPTPKKPPGSAKKPTIPKNPFTKPDIKAKMTPTKAQGVTKPKSATKTKRKIAAHSGVPASFKMRQALASIKDELLFPGNYDLNVLTSEDV